MPNARGLVLSSGFFFSNKFAAFMSQNPALLRIIPSFEFALGSIVTSICQLCQSVHSEQFLFLIQMQFFTVMKN